MHNSAALEVIEESRGPIVMKFLLDADHIRITQKHAGPESVVLMAHIAQMLHNQEKEQASP